MVIPHLFRCPISLDLFTDPVTLCTGQTYDRPSIEKWLAAGNLTCPVTMQKLRDPSIVPNHTLRHLIDQWLQVGHQYDPDYFETIHPHRSLAALKHILESHESTLQKKLQTLEKIQNLTKELPSQSSCLIQLGFFPVLLELVFGKMGVPHSQENLKLAEEALVCAIELVPFGNLGPLNMLEEESKLAYFLLLFNQGTMAMKINLCHLVDVICSSSETKRLCAVFGKNRGLLQGMILLLLENSEASEAGLKAISALCSLECNRESLVREGVVAGLITFILSSERSSAAVAVANLEQLLELKSAKEAVISHPSGVHALVKMVFKVSDHKGSESAVNSLMIMCQDSLHTGEEAIVAGVLTQLLLLLQSQCDARTKTRARMLLKLLRSMWAEKPKHV